MRSFIVSTLFVMVVLTLAYLGYQHFYLQDGAGTDNAAVEPGDVAATDGQGVTANGETAPAQASIASDIINSDTVQTGIDRVIAVEDKIEEKFQSNQKTEENAAAISDLEKQIADMQAKITEEDIVHRQLLKPLPQTPIFNREMPNARAERDRQVRAQMERKEKIKASGQRLRDLNVELQGLRRDMNALKRPR